MKPEIVFQNKSYFVLNKPAGWVVNSSLTTKNQVVLQKWLSRLDYPLAHNRQLRSGIVHRLDKDTSGVILVAKNRESFEYLQSQFKARKVKKTYVALVHGIAKDKKGTVKSPVGRLPWRRDRFGVLAGGRDAQTDYEVVDFLSRKVCKEGEKFSLLTVYPKTGRTHQIRIHLKSIGHPIVSDKFYAGRKTARGDLTWCPRLFLHAKSVSFVDKSGKRVFFESDLPKDLQKVLLGLERKPVES